MIGNESFRKEIYPSRPFLYLYETINEKGKKKKPIKVSSLKVTDTTPLFVDPYTSKIVPRV